MTENLHPHGTHASEGTRLLRLHLARTGESLGAFGTRTGISKQLVHWYTTGRGRPQPVHAAAIAKASQGEVPVGTWMEPMRGRKPAAWQMGCNDAIAPKTRAR